MKRLIRRAVLSSLAGRLRERGSWCGETHLQKAAYLLQDVAGVPLGFDFVLYKYGPFSFDLRETLDEMKAERLLELEVQRYPYGPRLAASPATSRLLEAMGEQVMRFSVQIDWVADAVRDRGVNALEALSTATLLRRRHPEASDDDLVRRLQRVKPHIPDDEAKEAVAEAGRLLSEAPRVASAP